MKTLFASLYIFILFSITASYGFSETKLCVSFYAGKPVYKKRLLTENGVQIHVNKETGSRMAYEYVPPRNPDPKNPKALGNTTLVFVQGLLNDMFSMQALQEKALADGFGVLRIDMHGFGRTFELDLEDNGGRLPPYDYRRNVSDIIDLKKSLNISNSANVGHSLGGGHVLKLSEVPYVIFSKRANKQNIDNPHYTLALAPYVSRVDKYLAEAFLSGHTTAESIAKYFKSISLSRETSDPLIEKFMAYSENLSTQIEFMLSIINFFFGTQRINDFLLDPKIDKFLRFGYKKYLLHEMGKEERELTVKELAMVDLRVEAGLEATKDVRDIDYLDKVYAIKPMNGLIQVVGGNSDNLVRERQITKFVKRAKAYGNNVEMVMIEGEGSDHFFPQNLPDRVYEIILEALTRPGL